MKDKDIYDLIENIEELDKLSFDYEQWEEFNLSDEDIEYIKSKTYKKMRCERRKHRPRVGTGCI